MFVPICNTHRTHVQDNQSTDGVSTISPYTALSARCTAGGYPSLNLSLTLPTVVLDDGKPPWPSYSPYILYISVTCLVLKTPYGVPMAGARRSSEFLHTNYILPRVRIHSGVGNLPRDPNAGPKRINVCLIRPVNLCIMYAILNAQESRVNLPALSEQGKGRGQSMRPSLEYFIPISNCPGGRPGITAYGAAVGLPRLKLGSVGHRWPLLFALRSTAAVKLIDPKFYGPRTCVRRRLWRLRRTGGEIDAMRVSEVWREGHMSRYGSP